MAEIDPTAFQSVGYANIKTVAEGPSFFTNLAFSNAVSDQQAKRAIENTLLAMWGKSFVETDPIESIAVKEMVTGNASADRIVNLATSLAATIGSLRTATVAPGPVANTASA